MRGQGGEHEQTSLAADPCWRSRVLVCHGVSQEELVGLLDELPLPRPVRIGLRLKEPELLVQLRVGGADPKDAELRLEEVVLALRGVLGWRLLGCGERTTQASALLELLDERQETLATAESCTGGLISKLLTDVPGSSACFLGAVVSYSNELKVRLLGVDAHTLQQEGAVSAAVARAMAEGLLALVPATWAISTTGIAGPGGGSPDKPVGTVHIGLAGPAGTLSESLHLPWERAGNRQATACQALGLLWRTLRCAPPPQEVYTSPPGTARSLPARDASAEPEPGRQEHR